MKFTKLEGFDLQSSPLVRKEEPRDGLCQGTLTHARGSEEQETSKRSIRRLKTCAGEPDCICNGIDDLVLADDAGLESVFDL